MNKSLICVPMKAKGVQFARKLDKIGMRSSDTAQIFFDNVRVPQRYLRRRGRQGLHLPDGAVPGRTAVGGARRLKGKERMIAETIDYARQRMIFGKSMLDNQVVHFRLAELQTEIELLRALVYRACELMLEGTTSRKLASMAKLKAGRLAREVADSCLQYWGGMGFMNETPVSRAYRDGRLGSIGGGADEVMLTIICRS